jgi:hypothetical protein
VRQDFDKNSKCVKQAKRCSRGVGRSSSTVHRRSISEPDALIVFTSSRYNYRSVLDSLQELFSRSVFVGCSSAGEFSTSGIGDGNISAFAIASDKMLFSGSMAEEITAARPERAAKTLLSGFRGGQCREVLTG